MFYLLLILYFQFALPYNVDLEQPSSIERPNYSQNLSTRSRFFGYDLNFRYEDNERLNLIIGSPRPQNIEEPNFHLCQISSNNSPTLTSPNCTIIPSPLDGTNRTLDGLTVSVQENDEILACYPSKTLDCNSQTRILPGFCYNSNDDGMTWTNLSNNVDDFCKRKSTLDLIFLLDGSGSVNASNFDIVKNWVKGVSSHFVLSDGYTQIGVIKFSTYQSNRPVDEQPFTRTEIGLGTIQNQTLFNNSVDRIRYIGGGTDTAKALNVSVLQFQTSERYSNANNSKVLVVLTDGRATDWMELPPTLHYLKTILKIKIFAIGVGDVDRDELRSIASSTNTRKDVFFVDNFNALDEIENELQQGIFSFALEGSSNTVETTSNLERGEKGFSVKTSMQDSTVNNVRKPKKM